MKRCSPKLSNWQLHRTLKFALFCYTAKNIPFTYCRAVDYKFCNEIGSLDFTFTAWIRKADSTRVCGSMSGPGMRVEDWEDVPHTIMLKTFRKLGSQLPSSDRGTESKRLDHLISQIYFKLSATSMMLGAGKSD